jgi:predicted ATPase
MRGSILLRLPEFNLDEANTCLLRALELSRRQGAQGWELRAAIDLATLMAGRGEIDSARQLLQPIAGRFMEGLGTADVQAAERLLMTLR